MSKKNDIKKKFLAVVLVLSLILVVSTAVSAGFNEFVLGECGEIQSSSTPYYQSGMPPQFNPNHNMIRQDIGPANSSFLSYVSSLGYSTNGWSYYMETWSDPNSSDPLNMYEVHYWSNGTTQFYHN